VIDIGKLMSLIKILKMGSTVWESRNWLWLWNGWCRGRQPVRWLWQGTCLLYRQCTRT